MSTDCVLDMFEELRTQLPPLPALVSDADARTRWLSAMQTIILSLPTKRQRTACVIQVADDLVTLRYPGLPIGMVAVWLCQQFGMEPSELNLEEEQS